MADVTTRPSNMMISIGKCKDSPIIIRHIADIHTTNLNATTMQGQVKTMEQKEILKGQHKKLQAPQAQQLLQDVGSVPGWPPQPAVRGHLPRGTLGLHLVQTSDCLGHEFANSKARMPFFHLLFKMEEPREQGRGKT